MAGIAGSCPCCTGGVPSADDWRWRSALHGGNGGRAGHLGLGSHGGLGPGRLLTGRWHSPGRSSNGSGVLAHGPMAKLHAHDRAQLVVLAYESGLVAPRDS